MNKGLFIPAATVSPTESSIFCKYAGNFGSLGCNDGYGFPCKDCNKYCGRKGRDSYCSSC